NRTGSDYCAMQRRWSSPSGETTPTPRARPRPRSAHLPGPAPSRAAPRARAAPPPTARPGVVPAARGRASAAPRHRSRPAPTRFPRTFPVARPSFLLSSRPRVGLLLLLLMPVPRHMVAVPGLLLGGELAGDIGVHLRPHRVEARAHRLPHRGHPGPVTLQDRPHRIALRGVEAQLRIQLVHHPIESPGALGRRRGRVADPERPAAGPDRDPRR